MWGAAPGEVRSPVLFCLSSVCEGTRGVTVFTAFLGVPTGQGGQNDECYRLFLYMDIRTFWKLICHPTQEPKDTVSAPVNSDGFNEKHKRLLTARWSRNASPVADLTSELFFRLHLRNATLPAALAFLRFLITLFQLPPRQMLSAGSPRAFSAQQEQRPHVFFPPSPPSPGAPPVPPPDAHGREGAQPRAHGLDAQHGGLRRGHARGRQFVARSSSRGRTARPPAHREQRAARHRAVHGHARLRVPTASAPPPARWVDLKYI